MSRLRLALVALGLLLFSGTAHAARSEAPEGTARGDAGMVGMGSYHVCAVVSSGQVRCWGSGQFGEMGQGNVKSIGNSPGDLPVTVDLGGHRAASIASNGVTLPYVGFVSAVNCALLDDGSVRCWGSGSAGQLAQGNTNNVGDDAGETTVEVDFGGIAATAVAVGPQHACAILTTGAVACWGAGGSGALAHGSGGNIGDAPGEKPVKVNLGGHAATAITAGFDFTCALLDDGSVRCWGANTSGQLAQGNTTSVGSNPGDVPVTVPLGSSATAISAGGYHACAVLESGALRCWGAGGVGELGQGAKGVAGNVGDNPGESTVQVDFGGRAVRAVSAGGFHTCAILDDDTLRCWGSGGSGALGQGSTTDIGDDPNEAPVIVSFGAGRTPRGVFAGGSDTCATLDDGTLRCWGANSYGQLMRGDTTPFGAATGETPAALGPINFGGLGIARNVDSDNLLDAFDACPTIRAYTANGCPPAGPAPSESPAPGAAALVSAEPPTGASPSTPQANVQELTLNNRTLTINALLFRARTAKRCPKAGKASATARLNGKKLALGGKGTLKVVAEGTGKILSCRAKGTVQLKSKPPKNSKIGVRLTGTGLKSRTLFVSAAG